MLYGLFMFVMGNLCKPFIREIKGLGNIPKKGFIIASNHASFIDPPLIASFIVEKFGIKVHYLGKKELFVSFFGRLLHKIVETIPIDKKGKDESGLEKAIETLKKGEVIGIFPEGGRSEDGKLQKGKTGVVRLALAARVPIVPACIKGTYEVWPRQKKLFKIKKIVKVNFGKPVYLDKYYKKTLTKKLLRLLTKDVMKKIAELCDQKYNY